MTELGYRRYLLAVTAAILIFNGVDTFALGLMLQNIKADLVLTDTQLGLLTGIAFSFFHSVVGIPISRWADRGNRVALIAITTTLWSVALVLSIFVKTFPQLFVLRACVAVGEAGCLPATLSLICDYFSADERPRAVSRFLQGGCLSPVFGYLLAGWLNQLYGWRVTFAILALPGLALAATVWWTLREPRSERGGVTSNASTFDRTAARLPDGAPAVHMPPSLVEVFIKLGTNKTFRLLWIFFSVSAFFNVGIFQWQPAFFVRSFGLKTGELGTWFAVISCSTAIVGTYLGGEYASRLGRADRQFKGMSMVYLLICVLSAAMYLSRNMYWAFGFFGIIGLLGSATTAPLLATIQTLAPERMRATATLLLLLFANLIGRGLGPLAVGALSDRLGAALGSESLRIAILAMCPGYIWSAWCLFRASRTVAADLQEAQWVSDASQAAKGYPLSITRQ